jgi:hypothetical protein
MDEISRPQSMTPRMRATVVVAGIAATVALGAALAFATAPVSTSTVTAASTPEAPGAAPGAEGATESRQESAAPTVGPSPGATPEAGSEVLPPSTPPAGGMPDLPAAAPRVTVPLPASGSALGVLVAGFPVEIAAPLEGSDVLDSAVAAEGDVLQFSLRARSDTTSTAVLHRYAELWGDLGLTPEPDDATGAAYRDEYSSVAVAAETTSTGVVYAIYGTLRAG